MSLGQRVLLVLLIAFSGWIGVMVGDRELPIVRYSGVMTPDGPTPGSRVRVSYIVKYNRTCPATVTRTITDSTGTLWRLSTADAEYTVGNELSRSFFLPVGIAWGPAEYRATVSYVCNPLQNAWPIVSVGPVVRFNVAPPPE
jgi:hypothetical protein